jgi:hypothetical protein
MWMTHEQTVIHDPRERPAGDRVRDPCCMVAAVFIRIVTAENGRAGDMMGAEKNDRKPKNRSIAGKKQPIEII